ncbi:hypothetical protein AZ468_23315 [Vibrio europaeus]|uniref:Uncharacterized protein n=3 Tax=Vibrio oreintalis group TaxID=1891919 RepID=A0A178J8F7_9VIBR|nr:hypothetical protein [Vibrio europaeus]NOI82043.1 hypothetical protein [Vibrio tubiashii]OAM98443.1 hypothetical protein AZ468_23315 [Vibrio europaeus]
MMSMQNNTSITLDMIHTAINKVEIASKIDLNTLKDFISENTTSAVTSFTEMSQCDSLDDKFKLVTTSFPQFIDHSQHLIETSILLSS